MDMKDYNYIKARWERACERYYYAYSMKAYSEETITEMWFLCETLEDILELPARASAERVEKLAEEKRKGIVA